MSNENSLEHGSLEKAAEAGAIFAVPRKVKIARERKGQSIDRSIIPRDNGC